MGKASRWIRNFLTGNKEDRKKNDASFLMDCQITKQGSQPGTPKVKRKWSFGKASGKDASHRFSKSLDSIDTSKLPIQALAKRESQSSHAKALAAIQGHIECAAATKIQSIFRSYLARKALHALRGLVKLQALVRGHLVRKQTTNTLKRMHALMAIQVRARVQRIQLAAAEEAQFVVKAHSSSFHKGFTSEIGVRAAHRDRNKVDVNPNETRFISKSSSGHLNHSQMERIGSTIDYSGRLSISKRNQYEEYRFSSAENQTRTSFIHQQPNHPNNTCNGLYSFLPNYMANTESSKAKYRSQSEPKQRPKWNNIKQKAKHTEIMDVVDITMDDQALNRTNTQFRLINGIEDHDAWFLKLYGNRRNTDNGNCDSTSTATSHSNYCESFTEYEPYVNMF